MKENEDGFAGGVLVEAAGFIGEDLPQGIVPSHDRVENAAGGSSERASFAFEGVNPVCAEPHAQHRSQVQRGVFGGRDEGGSEYNRLAAGGRLRAAQTPPGRMECESVAQSHNE